MIKVNFYLKQAPGMHKVPGGGRNITIAKCAPFVAVAQAVNLRQAQGHAEHGCKGVGKAPREDFRARTLLSLSIHMLENAVYPPDVTWRHSFSKKSWGKWHHFPHFCEPDTTSSF